MGEISRGGLGGGRGVCGRCLWKRLKGVCILACIPLVLECGLIPSHCVAMSPPLTATPTVKPPTTLSGPQTSPFPPGTPLPEHRMELLRTVLRTIGEHLKLRQSSVKPFFKDFDKVTYFWS